MTVLAAALAGCAAWLAVRPPRRTRRDAHSARTQRSEAPRGHMTRILCAVAGVLLALVIGGVVGVLVGASIAIAGPHALARLESRSQRQRRIELERQAPQAADLLSACLAAGATPVESARAVARALGEPIAVPLDRLTGALDLGADPVGAWMALGAEGRLRAIARAVARSAETGAPLALLLAAVADDQRDEARMQAESAARAAGVRSVAPLVACFLPAFILIGIVPIVASLALPLLQ